MSKKYDFKLIHGTFTSSEAAQVLFNLIDSKIHFHSMENFSSNERFGKDAPNSLKRIKALKEAQDNLKKIFAAAERTEVRLKIESSVKVTIVE